MSVNPILKAPFPYPGGKSRVADYVWARIGNVGHAIEPFAGSIAWLLRRPEEHFRDGEVKRETCNDVNHFLVNFWRAVQADPEGVAKYADGIVAEADLHARHRYLAVSTAAEDFRAKIVADPDYFDPKFAGWWVWGISCWIGAGWCDNSRPKQAMSMPEISIAKGGHSAGGLHQSRPALNCAHGVHAGFRWGGTCESKSAWLRAWMQRLSDRLRNVRVCHGHWSRICDSDSTLTRLGVSGVFLDPPYPAIQDDGTKSRDGNLYMHDKTQDLLQLRDGVLAWCQKWGQSNQLRIAVCGYEGDGYDALLGEGWTSHTWKSTGGYGNQRKKGPKKNENASRERIWFSPRCVAIARVRSIFDDILL